MNEAEDISGYLMPEVETVLKKGLPVTAYAAACDGTIAGCYTLLFQILSETDESSSGLETAYTTFNYDIKSAFFKLLSSFLFMKNSSVWLSFLISFIFLNLMTLKMQQQAGNPCLL